MAPFIPHLALSHGQVAWCLAGGEPPSQVVLDRLRYLRRLGIPFEDHELGKGRGVRVQYGFYQFIEVGVAFEGLRRRIAPRLLLMLRDEREGYRAAYLETYDEIAPHAELFEGDPRRHTIFENELVIRFFDQFSKYPGAIKIDPPPAMADEPATRFPEELAFPYGRDVVGLKTLMVRLLTLARIAPQTKTGPKQ